MQTIVTNSSLPLRARTDSERSQERVRHTGTYFVPKTAFDSSFSNTSSARRRAACVVTDIFVANHFFELGLTNESRRLLPRAAENKCPLGRVQLTRHFFQREQSSGVDSCHVTQAQNHHGGQLVHLLRDH